MATEEERVKIIFDTNAADAAKDNNKLSKSLDSVEDSTKKATKSTKASSEANEKSSKSTKDQSKAFEDLDGSIGQAISGFKAMLKQMWLIVANPLILTVVAIVGGLALLFKAFTSTNEGADKFDQILSGVSATIDILRDRFLKMAGAITKFMTGDFKGAMAEGRAAVSGFGAEVEKEFKIAANATKELQEVEDAMRSLGETRAMLNRDLAAAKEIITDDTASYSDKKKAIDSVREAEGKQTENELANAKRKLKAIQDLNALSDTSDEDLKKESDAKIALYNLESESANNRRAINRADARADSEEKSRLKVISDARKQANKERLAQLESVRKARQALLDEELSAEKVALRKIQDINDKTEEEKLSRQKERDLEEIERLKQKGVDVRDLLTYNTELYATLEDELIQKRAEEKAEKQKLIDEKAAEEKKTADEKAAAEQLKVDQAILAQKKSIQDGQLQLADSAVGFLSRIAGKNKLLQKAAIIAESALGIGKSVIATNASNVAATAEGAALAIPTAGASVAAAAGLVATNYATLGLGVAGNIAATAKALQALGGGSSPSGGGGSASSGVRGSAPPTVAFNNTAENQIGQSVAKTQSEQPPLKVFVSESDISKAQNNVKVLVDKNVF